MSISLYQEFLEEEEKFLKQLERNLKHQINRMKVEELSLLKLISESDPSDSSISSFINHDILPGDTLLLNTKEEVTQSGLAAFKDIDSDEHLQRNIDVVSEDNDSTVDAGCYTSFQFSKELSRKVNPLDKRGERETSLNMDQTSKINDSHLFEDNQKVVDESTFSINAVPQGSRGLPKQFIRENDVSWNDRISMHLDDVAVNKIPLNLDRLSKPNSDVLSSEELNLTGEESENEDEDESSD